LKVGFAISEITPPLGIPLSGYGFFRDRKADGVSDPLYVRAVGMEDEEPALILAFDLLGLDSLLVARLRRKLADMAGIPRDHLMLTCTHTHSGPNVMPLRGEPRRRGTYLRDLVEQAGAAGQEALDQARTVRGLSRFRTRFGGFSWNRAFADGEVSREVSGMVARTSARTVVLVNYACHPVTLGINTQISADYPGAFNQMMARAGICSLFLTGPCGDLDPVVNRDSWGRGTKELANQYAKQLLRATLRGISRAKPFRVDQCSVATANFRAPYRVPGRRELKEALAKARQVKEDPDKKALFEICWARDGLNLLRSGRFAKSATLYLQAFRVGEVVVIALPAEVFFEFGEAIRAPFPETEVLIATSANSVVGYIPSERDFEAGGYASGLACKFYKRFPFEPGIGVKLVDRSIKLIRSLLR